MWQQVQQHIRDILLINTALQLLLKDSKIIYSKLYNNTNRQYVITIFGMIV